jgi:hypothetical protein
MGKQPKEFYSLEVNNEYFTPSYAVEPLLEFLEKFRNSIIWCPFDKEESEFVRVLTNNGYKVIYSHVDTGQNFFTYEPDDYQVIVSNPPFQNKKETFERLLSFNKPFAMLMTLTWLNDSAPKKLFRDKDLQLLMFEERIKYKNACEDKINFSSAYYCYNFLPKQIIMRSLKENKRQMRLF